MIKAIVFDMDDTLVITSKIKYLAHKHAAKKFYNLNLTDEDLDRHWGKPFKDIMISLYGKVDNIEKIIENYYSISQDFPLIAHEHAVTVLTKLVKKIPLGLLTAANVRLMSDALSNSGIDQKIFAHIQTSDDTSVHKPDPKVFDPTLKFFSGLGINPGEIVYVGDVLDDFYAAKSAGLHFIGIAGNSIPKTEFAKVGAAAVDSLLDLIDHLTW